MCKNTQRGVRQAELLGIKLDSEPEIIEDIFTSPMVRTIETSLLVRRVSDNIITCGKKFQRLSKGSAKIHLEKGLIEYSPHHSLWEYAVPDAYKALPLTPEDGIKNCGYCINRFQILFLIRTIYQKLEHRHVKRMCTLC